jgi:hypothetical protein
MEKQEKSSSTSQATEEQSQNETYRPRKLSLSDNLILTIKVLAGAGLFAGLIWTLDYLAA